MIAVALVLLQAPVFAAEADIELPVLDRQDIRFTTLAIDGVPFKRWVLCVARDKYGFLWLGTVHGLYRYDGYNLKNFRHDPGDPRSLSDDTVRAILSDHSGNLWIGTNFGGVDQLDPATDTFIHHRYDPARNGSLSGNLIPFLYEDRAGTLWVATNGGLDRLDSVGGDFKHYRHDPNDPSSLSSNGINAIYEDRQRNLWVGTNWGLNRLDRRTGRVTRFMHDPTNPRSLGGNYVGPIREDGAGVLWIGTGSALDALNRTSGEFTHYPFQSEVPGEQGISGITSIHEDRSGALWLGTVRNGILKLDRGREEFTHYTSDPFDPGSLVDNNIHAVIEDPEGMIWACTKAGVSRFFSSPGGFVRYQRHENGAGGLRDNVIWSVWEDSRGYLWIGTWNGLHRLDRRTGRVDYYHHDRKNRYSLSSDTVSAIREDRAGNIWLATYGGGLDRLDPRTGRFSAYHHDPRNPESLSSDNVLCLLLDREGYLWAGTGDGGLNRLDSRTGHFSTYRHVQSDPNSLSEDNVKVLFEDRQGTLWIGTNQGLTRLDRPTGRFTVYRNSSQPDSLSSDVVDSIYEDHDGTLWIGCRNGLNRMDRNRGTFTTIGEKDGLPDGAVEAILEDAKGVLWLGTGDGLSQFNPHTKTFRNYSETDGLAGSNMDPYGSESACRTRQGEMVFGSTEGLTIFRPEDLARNPYVPPVVLTDFLLSGKSVRPGKGSPLAGPIWAVKSVRLDHTQNIFSMEFSALSYTAPEKNRYRYRLEGLEQQWNEGDGKRRLATYTNLPPRSYVFRVQAANNAGVWNDNGATLTITVLPPWWGTWWFRSLLALCVTAVTFAAYRLRIRNLRSTAARLERQVAERTRELSVAKEAAESANRAKSAFLASMSHELRTPLNAILGFSSLMRNHGATEEQRRDLDIISSSGGHLLGLINDILDVAKIEAGHSVLEVAACDVKAIVRDVAEMIRLRAETKKLALLVDAPAVVPPVRADAARLRQILINLLGNAVKYTEEGSVTLNLNIMPGPDADHVLLGIDVADTGIGIASEDQARIFEPFIQVSTARSRQGTGLGLTITKRLVESMGGSIEVESAPGKGSCFRVRIPVEPARESEMKLAVAGAECIPVLEPGQPEYRILIVEDEPQNWMLLERLLRTAGFHQVQVAQNGAEGVERFRQWHPHFIWLDLQMPVMNGIEAARRIRELEGGSEVRIAAVTASRFKSQRDEVLAAGIDDFVLKPYRAAEVLECIARHLGVRYQREEAQVAEVHMPGTKLEPAVLSELPAELRTELRQALLALDVNRVAEVIERISVCDPALGSVLAGYANQYAYSAMLSAVDGGEGKSPVAGVSAASI
jgi:signal transduction histidine kinase/ligand-binding sensor domain-containing protein/CheY-like chemotaxis protein